MRLHKVSAGRGAGITSKALQMVSNEKKGT
jgi:hypothetical protein